MNDLTHENLIKLMQIRPSIKEAADWFNTSQDTIDRRIKKFEKLTFAEFKEKHSTNTRHKLIDRAMEQALNGNATMMIFCLKNYCGWADNATTEINSEPKVTRLAYSPDQLKEAAKAYTEIYGEKKWTS